MTPTGGYQNHLNAHDQLLKFSKKAKQLYCMLPSHLAGEHIGTSSIGTDRYFPLELTGMKREIKRFNVGPTIIRESEA